MFGVLAADIKTPVPFDDLAAAADFLDRTAYLHKNGKNNARLALQPPDDTTPVPIRAQLEKDRVSRQYSDIMDLHLACQMAQDHVFKAVHFDPEGKTRQCFDHLSLYRLSFIH
jgi:hypothetical protein